MKKKIFGSLSSNVFEQRASAGSEIFPLLLCLDATKFILLSVFTVIEMICLNVCSYSRLKFVKSPLSVDVLP